MEYMITGNKGLIGTHLKKRLDREGHKCVMQIDKREGFDVTDLMFKDYELSDKVDTFFHFAAQCRINEAIANPILPHKNNCDGILSVLEFCRKHEIPKIVYASTSRVLSKERNPYVASKIYGEELCKAYSDCYGLEHIVVRPSTVYGPMKDETSRLINNWMTSAFKDEDLRLYGNVNKTLDFTYIDDFVNGVVLATNGNPNNSYNISGGETNLMAVAQYIIRKTKSKSKIVMMPPEKAQPQQVKVDTSDIEKLGYTPKVQIWEGLDRMIKFYEQNSDVWKEYEDKGRKFYRGKFQMFG